MFVPRIGHLDKTRFGINFKADDIKCNISQSVKTNIGNKIFKEDRLKKVERNEQ